MSQGSIDGNSPVGNVKAFSTNDVLNHNHQLRRAIRKALDELGVPGEGYPAPIANAVEILRAALPAENE